MILEPLECQSGVRVDANSLLQHLTELAHRLRISRLGGAAEPVHCRAQVLRGARPVERHASQDGHRKGISALPSDLFYSQVVDVNYMAGLTWSRQPGVRVLYHPSNALTLGLSLENAEQYIGGSAGGSTVVLPSALAAVIGNQVNNGNTTLNAPNLHPDIIAKVAYDAKIPSGRLIPLCEVVTRASELDPDKTTVVHCQGGIRSAKAIEQLKSAGFEGRLINLKGGIRAWSDDVDPSVPKY